MHRLKPPVRRRRVLGATESSVLYPQAQEKTVIYIVYTLHIITCLFLIMVVLLQQGKGADLSVFGGGTTQAAFGARGAATVLHKLTVGFFVLFMVTTISIGVLQRGRSASSVMKGVETSKDTTAPAPAEPPVAAPAAPAAPQDSAPASGQSETTLELAPDAAPQTEAPAAAAGTAGAAAPPASAPAENPQPQSN